MTHACPQFLRPIRMLVYAAILGFMSIEPSLDAAAIANFSEGTGNATPDQFVGKSGNGWSNAWLTSNGSNGATAFHVMTSSDTGYSPLNEGGNYLQIDYQRTSTGGTARAGVAREFDIAGAGSVNLTQPYEIHFSFRLDQLTGFSSSTDQILFSTEDRTAIGSSQGAAPWYLWIRGDEEFSVQNGDGEGGAGRVKLSTLGLSVETGVVYSVSVYLNPLMSNYDLTISNGTTTYRASDANGGALLQFRTNALASGANVFQARMINNDEDDHFIMSLDNVSIIPEPSAMALLGGAWGLLSIFRCCRNRLSASR